MDYSPETLYLKKVKNRLGVLDIPIYFKLPKSDVLEPFIVVGTNISDLSKTAQTGAVIDDFSLNIDAFLPGDSRLDAEEIKSRMLRLLGRNNQIKAQILVDNSIGREVYRVAINITEILI
ncbi:TPA: hypothetical protein ACGN4E_000714 [Streptococcus agalactiae]|uniref:hypothetical protein n=1 Tax=Streptococcus agalactiae TaxID=1311 RepID=UPI0002B9E3E7|nr:hypothetical protein [Streptococcus agalactiae]EPU68788.1 hypothetical protein SAG0308_05750 [Streptococcus agalactiae GB00084]EPU76764.1 hypothetical protein SAG0312_06095 [Streptococcus agalactiae GB00115]EPU94174.1 hypothetical protein SAG0322_00085 [Streptococcus agalactiae GB00264]EPU95376.1 hypothetical protein SAG0323_02565 [Streptococcus agalactiae GB00279]EPV17741.1 hypothetical protein SAG0330_11055 [Streptococcus agalactiae GB00561]